jgi:hypothetical protein
VLVQDRGGIVRTRLIPSIGIILAALAAGSGIVGVTLSAFSAPTSNVGSSFATASSFGGSCGTAPTPVWINGMEHGSTQTPDIFSQSLGAGSYDATVAHTGTGSLRVAKPTTSIAYIRKAASGNTQVLHFALRIATVPTGDVTLASLDSSFGIDLLVRYQASTQKLALQWGAEAPVVALSTVTSGTWYSIDLKSSTGVSPLTASWRIDGIDQPNVSSNAAATSQGNLHFGTSASESPTYAVNFDDIFYSRTLADYPLGDVRIRALRPNGVGTHNNANAFRNNDDSAIDANSWTRLDDASVFGGTDYVKQVVAATTGYLEFSFENTTESCILATWGYSSMGSLGSQGNTMKSSVFDGATERVIYSGGSPCGSCTQPKNALIAPAVAPWSQSAVNGLVVRTGYASADSPQPYWGVLMLEYAAK